MRMSKDMEIIYGWFQQRKQSSVNASFRQDCTHLHHGKTPQASGVGVMVELGLQDRYSEPEISAFSISPRSSQGVAICSDGHTGLCASWPWFWPQGMGQLWVERIHQHPQHQRDRSAPKPSQ